jgi:DNA-binding LacI/PurR family transcriptional regulator
VISANNDRAICDGLFPELTTIDPHIDRLAELAVERLTSRVSPDSIRSIDAIEVSIFPTLVTGQSVADLTA